MPVEKAPMEAPDLEIFGDKVTIHPSGYTGGPQDGPITERNLVSHMARFRENPFDFLREVSLYMSGTGWRAYNDVIGQPIFYPGFSERIKSSILASPILQAKVKELAEMRLAVEEKEGLLQMGQGPVSKKKKQRRAEIESNLKEVVDTMMDNMICKMESKTFIRGAYYLCTQLLTRAYHQGKDVSQDFNLCDDCRLLIFLFRNPCIQRGSSALAIGCPRSSEEEAIYRLFALPQVSCRLRVAAAYLLSSGNWLADRRGRRQSQHSVTRPFSTTCRYSHYHANFVPSQLTISGAMWIRRSFGNDPLYHTVVQAYIDTLLQKGFNFECFIEGGRSRTGKLLSPKFGILNFIVDSLLSGRVEDTIICPVSTQYDKVIETEYGTPERMVPCHILLTH